MYRLSLDDPRLALPVAVYQLQDELEGRTYALRDTVEQADRWDLVESVPFYAVEPGRAAADLVPVYAVGRRLSTEAPALSEQPLFYASPADAKAGDNACIVSLYEYRQADSERRIYRTESPAQREGWIRTQEPLCQVWKTPEGPLLLDAEAKPLGR